MTENTPFDYVWLGLLIGCYDLGSGGLEQMLNQLIAMGLVATKARILDAEDNQENYESDDIAHWAGEELTQQGIKFSYSSGIDIHDTTNLISSMRPGVWANLPQKAQNHFVEAEKSIHNGLFNGAAQLLVSGVESMMKHFYAQLLPSADRNCTWSDMENSLFALKDRELTPTLFCIKGYRHDRNQTVHGDQDYDKYEVVALWHQSMQAVSRMASVLERRSSLPHSG